MEAKTVHALLNIALLQAITFLFVYIKYYFSEKDAKDAKVKSSLQENELAVSILIGILVFFVIATDHTSLPVKYVFFILAVVIHIGACLIIQKHQRTKPMLYPKAFLIFHNGSFLKGAILQNKLTEKEIIKSLNTRGVKDLTEVDTIILEPNGELSVIFKKKAKA